MTVPLLGGARGGFYERCRLGVGFHTFKNLISQLKKLLN
jgi:hypothetical protein